MIRAKNVDLETEYFKGHVQASVGSITASRNEVIFVAPYACKVESVDIISTQGVSGHSDNNMAFVVRNADASANAGSRGTSATAGTSDDLISSSRYRILLSSNNSMTQGGLLQLRATLGGSGVTSGTLVHVRYTFLKHRGNR